MTVITVDDLHLVQDPDARLRTAASIARVQAGSDHQRIIVRAPDRATDALRVLRLDDIAGMLQRHGRIVEAGVTDGGTIVAAADVCDRRGEVAVWTGPAIGPWSPADIVQRGLGGSETAAVRLAEELAAMGYVVTLYGDFEHSGSMAGDVMLKHYSRFDPSERLDALVGFRNATLFDRRPNAERCILWLEDLAPAEGLTPARAANIDRVVGVTHWHAEQIKETHPWLDAAKVAAGRNGIKVEWFQEEPAPERECRVVYSSSPDRGGDIVLECWGEIKRQVPDAELILTYPRWFELCADQFMAANSHRERLRELVKQPGVSRVETGLGQKSLANLMRASLVWVNPGYYSPGRQKFNETSCISAMEAQAAGCVAIASNWGAVTETLQHGTLIDGDPSVKNGAWRKRFISAVVQGLTDPVVQAAAQTVGPDMVRDMGWRGAAEQLAAMLPPARKLT